MMFEMRRCSAILRRGPAALALAPFLLALAAGPNPAAAQEWPDVKVYHSPDGVYPSSACPAGCTPTVPQVQSAATIANAKTVAVFDNPSYVDTANATSSESDTVQASLVSLGHTVSTFTGITAADWQAAAAAADLILIPEQERGALSSALDSSAQSAIAGYVASGGSLVVMGHGSNDISLLNALFGFALAPSGYALSQLDPAVAAGTPFEGGPASLPANNYTPGVSRSSLPEGAFDLYHDATANYVFTVPFGAGQVARLGWDWFNAAPLGLQDGGWIEVLSRTVDAVGNGDPTPCDCVIKGGQGEQLELWIDGGSTASGVNDDVCKMGPTPTETGATGDELCGADILIEVQSGTGQFTDIRAVIGTLVHQPDCADSPGEDGFCPLPFDENEKQPQRIRMNFRRGAATPMAGPRKIADVRVDSTGSDEVNPTTIVVSGVEAASANLKLRPIAGGTPEVIAAGPVPEPAQIWQLMSGLAGLGCLYRLRRRA